MVSAADVKELALVPVRGTVFVVKLPFVLVWTVLAYICALLYSVVAKIVSVPVSWAKRVGRRVQLTWAWTKGSARAILPWRCDAGTDRALAVRRREEFEDQLYDADLGYGLDRALRSKRSRKGRRKAIIASLIRILLEPASPAESEDEPEIVEEDEDGKVYKLIRDLVQFSRSRPNSSLALQSSSGQHRLDIETLRQHARDKEKLQNLISELDQYVNDMDAGSKQAEGVGRRRAGPLGHVAEAGSDEEQEMVTPELTVSSIPDPDIYMDASEGDTQASGDESGGEVYGEGFDDAHLTLSASRLQGRELSPVAEVSPEVLSMGSTPESTNRNCVDLESELNTALSRLSTLTNELTEVEESVFESRQTMIPETVTSSGSSFESNYEDAEDDFPSIPKTSPTLGLEAGHSKRNLATARKARPPSLPKGSHGQQGISDGTRDKGGKMFSLAREDSQEFEEGSSRENSCEEEEGDEAEGDEAHREKKTHKLPPGAVRVLPPSLSDQFQLLTPSSSRQDPSPSHQTTSDLYSAVNKKPLRSRSEGEGRGLEEHTPPESERYRSQSDSAGKSTGKSLFMSDLTPPWKLMRTRTSSTGSCDSSPNIPQSHASSEQPSSQAAAQQSTPTAPPLPSRGYTPPPNQSHTLQQGDVTRPDSESADLYDRLPRVLPAPPIPSRAGEEGLYDIIPGQARQQHQYLHEKLAAGKEQARSTPPVSWTPQLPPRNSAKLKRSGSAEVMGTLVKDKDRHRLVRHESDRRSSASLTHEYRERSDSSSSSKRVRSSSTERDRERKIKRSSSDERHHHGRSGEHSPTKKHTSSGSSSERHRSSSGRSSSEKHRRLSEKHRSSSEKHRSSEKSSPPSPKSSEGGSSFVWRILTGTASSKKKSSPPTEAPPKGSRDKKESRTREGKENKKEERREEKREQKHSSSARSRERRGSGSSSGRTHRTASHREEDDSMPRNESSASLKSGVSMHSTDSSGRDSLV